ncbi:UDP-3-O-(3-hydroxymyristoyl)glucosamine N-acyltransferase [Adhaeretor mobilis]|uniref:UDP-3-O-acylglucosamine N-acyltransferase n=1 Tax=Adhaeretor mobilis TaxID=1930276 RepID=A0A517MUG3_9BACT|nr:UDP-3-O-(3-hydroxymyristoyl)glucosamine N-acyltransferase [Adhaeretor mobilis]QDS98520.1 UDP-3-O-acylglucosamine N-acyltransferase [Adhaeretor mobilis]
MTVTLARLAEIVGGRLVGDGSLVVTNVRRLDLAGPTEVTFAADKNRQNELTASQAGAAIVSADIECGEKPSILVDDVNEAFTKAVLHFRPKRISPQQGVSDLAIVGERVTLGKNVEIHPGATIGNDVVLGDDVTIHSGVQILPGCKIGTQTVLFPNVVLYEDTQIGARCVLHGGAVIGAYGFGYQEVGGRHKISEQLGNVEIGDDVEIGASSTIDRGTFGPTLVGEGTKIDNLVMIAHNCQIGRHNLICSQVGVAGSTITGDYVVMAGQAGIRDHVNVGQRAVIGSMSGVTHDVPDGEIMLGAPATPVREQRVKMAALAKLPEMRRQFRSLQKQVIALQQLQNAHQQPAPGEQAA